MRAAVIEQNLHFLRQGAELLRRLDDGSYAASGGSRARAAGPGSHFRHCLDFYRCFLRDLGSGKIDFDRRDRMSRIETDRLAALAATEEILEQLQRLADDEVSRRIEVRHDPAPFEDAESGWHQSTVGRELRFLASHTIHHFALIANLLRQHGFEPEEEFGVAPATLAHWHSQA